MVWLEWAEILAADWWVMTMWAKCSPIVHYDWRYMALWPSQCCGWAAVRAVHRVISFLSVCLNTGKLRGGSVQVKVSWGSYGSERHYEGAIKVMLYIYCLWSAKLFLNHYLPFYFGTSFTKEKVSLYLHFCCETDGRLICIIVLLHNKAIWKSLKVTKLAYNNAVDDDCSDHIQSEHTICQCVGPSYWCLLVVTLTANVVLFKWQM